MTRIAIPTLDSAPEASRPVLDAVHTQLGMVPNLYRLVSLSPNALGGFVAFSGALAKTLDVKTRERIALAVAEVNRCDYCLSAHSFLGLNLAKLSQEEIDVNRNGRSLDPKADAAVAFAREVAETRGHVATSTIDAVTAAGFTSAQLVEIVAIVAENSFTNFINSVAQTDVDFPLVTAAEMA